MLLMVVLTSGLVAYAKSNDKNPQQEWDVIHYGALYGANEDIVVGTLSRYTKGSDTIVEKRHYEASGRSVVEFKVKLLGNWYTFQTK